ncbi:hypothetical protein [Pseudomonas paracarnis]|uniref:hypothetical protein n=1 Tax=Pseudomonas paracarnis TaxID=2750625 RepID=UPI003F92448A
MELASTHICAFSGLGRPNTAVDGFFSSVIPKTMSALACAAIERIAGDSYRTVADSLSSSSEFVKAYRGLEIPTAKVVSFAPYLSQKRQQISPLDSIMLSIRQMTDYEQDWDGYGALAPAAQAADDAEFFAIYNLRRRDTRAPKISAASDGEINFSWKNEKGLIDLGFFGDGSYSYYAKLSTGEEFISDESGIKEALPSELLKIITL